MRPRGSLLALTLAISCARHEAPTTEAPPAVVHLVQRPGAIESIAGAVADLVTELPTTEATLRGEAFGADLFLASLPSTPVESSLKVAAKSGEALTARSLEALLAEPGFAYVPSTRRLGPDALAVAGATRVAQQFDPAFLPGHVVLGDESHQISATFPAFDPALELRVIARSNSDAQLHLTLGGSTRALAASSRNWTSLATAFALEPGVVTLSISATTESNAPPHVEIAWIELSHMAPASLVVRHPAADQLQVAYRPSPPQTLAGSVLLSQATAETRRLASEIDIPAATSTGSTTSAEAQRLASIHRVLSRCEVNGDRRVGYWLPTDSELAVNATLAESDSLRFAVGITDDPPPQPGALPLHLVTEPTDSTPVAFRVTWNRPDLEPIVLDQTELNPTTSSWVEREISVLPDWAGTGTLRFETTAERVTPAAFAEPRIVRAGADPSPLPNVLVYVIDTLRADHLSCYGAKQLTSPNMDALAEDGLLFEQFYAVAPWTRPTTATVLTGFHPNWHGMGKELPLARELRTLAESMRHAGYSTWAAVANPQVGDENLQFDQGFDRFVDQNGIGATLDPARQYASSREMNATVLPWIAAHSDEPFFLYLHSLDPHTPYAPPPEAKSPFGREYSGPWRERSLRRAEFLARADDINEADRRFIEDVYDNEIHYQDEQIQVLLDALRDANKLEDTVIAILSDHGEEFYEHGDWNHGYRMWEELLRVPLIVWVPPKWRTRLGGEPQRVATPVSQIDFLPGLLDLVGVEDTYPRQGKSWLPLLRDPAFEPSPVYAEDYQTWTGDEIGTIRAGRYKLLWNSDFTADTTVQQLFDLDADPTEQNDLAAEHPEIATRLFERRESINRNLSGTSDTLRAAGFNGTRPLTGDAEAAEVDPRLTGQLRELGYAGDD